MKKSSYQNTIPFKVVPGSPASVFVENFSSSQPKHKKNFNENTVSTKSHQKNNSHQNNTFRGGARESRERFLVGTHPLCARADKISAQNSQKSAL